MGAVWTPHESLEVQNPSNKVNKQNSLGGGANERDFPSLGMCNSTWAYRVHLPQGLESQSS